MSSVYRPYALTLLSSQPEIQLRASPPEPRAGQRGGTTQSRTLPERCSPSTLFFTAGTNPTSKNTQRFTGQRFTPPNNVEGIRAPILVHMRISWGAFKISSFLYPTPHNGTRISRDAVCALVFLKALRARLACRLRTAATG